MKFNKNICVDFFVKIVVKNPTVTNLMNFQEQAPLFFLQKEALRSENVKVKGLISLGYKGH